MNLSSRTTATSLLAVFLLIAACTGGDPQQHLAAARHQLAKHDAQSAVIELKNALQKDPELVEARFLLGEALLEAEDFAGAVIELRKARDSQYSNDQVGPPLARAMLAQREFQKIIAEFSATTLSDARAMADLKTTLAIAYTVVGQSAEGEVQLRTALQLAPDHVPAQIFQARLLAAKGDAGAAADLLRKVLEAHPSNAEAWKSKGDLLRLVTLDDQGALTAYLKAIEFNPRHLEARSEATLILMLGADVEPARKQLEQLKALAPQHPQTRYLQARLAFREQRYREARAHLQDVLRAVPDFGPGLELAGATELKVGTAIQAQLYFAKALQIAPNQISVRRLLAESQLQAGKPSEALATMQPVLGRTADARSLALAARAHLQLGETKQSEAYFARAIKLDPADTVSRTHLAVATMGRGQVNAGLEELERLAATDAGTTADMALISAHLARRKFDAALKAIDALERKAENKAVVENLRGRALLLMRDADGARKSFERALAAEPGFYTATASLAAMDLAAEKPDAARKRYEAVLRADANHVRALLDLAALESRDTSRGSEVVALLERAIKADPNDTSPRLKLVGHYLATQQPKLALVAAQNAAAIARDNLEVQDSLGRSQLAVGDHHQALATYTRLASQQPRSPRVLLGLAEAKLAANDRDGARESLQQLLAIDSKNSAAIPRLAMLELKSKRPQQALALARQLQKDLPKSPLGYALEGDSEILRNKPEAAMVAYRRAFEIAPTSEIAAKVDALLRKGGKKDEADRFAAEWVKNHPTDARFRYHLADESLMRGDLSRAEALYREVVKIAPDNYLALNNVAWTMLRQNKTGAVEFAEKANRIKAGDPALMDTLALVLAHERQFDRAIDVQRDALRITPGNHLIRLNMARIYLDAGRKEQAKEELDALAALGDKVQIQSEVNRLLEVLKRS